MLKILFLSLKIMFLFLLPENSDLSLMLVYSKFLFPGFSASVSYLNHILTFFYFYFCNFIVHLSCCKPHPLFWNCVLPPCPSLHHGNWAYGPRKECTSVPVLVSFYLPHVYLPLWPDWWDPDSTRFRLIISSSGSKSNLYITFKQLLY